MEKSTSKPNKEHDAQIAAQARKDAEKEFKQIAEKVNNQNILVQIDLICFSTFDLSILLSNMIKL